MEMLTDLFSSCLLLVFFCVLACSSIYLSARIRLLLELWELDFVTTPCGKRIQLLMSSVAGF